MESTSASSTRFLASNTVEDERRPPIDFRAIALTYASAMQQPDLLSPLANHGRYNQATSVTPSVPSSTRPMGNAQHSCNGMSSLSMMIPDDIRSLRFPLPMKLYAVLSCPDFLHIVTWMPHGRAWKILHLEAFTEIVLPILLSYCLSQDQTFDTFVRLLKIWGFRQFTKGNDAAAFYNDTFIRGIPALIHSIRPSESNRGLHVPNEEPDFYACTSSSGFGINSDTQIIMDNHLSPAPGNQMMGPWQINQNQVKTRSLPLLPEAHTLHGPKLFDLPSRPSGRFVATDDHNRNHGSERNVSFCIDSWRNQMENELRAAKNRHERTVSYLECARRVVDNVSTTFPDLALPLPPHTGTLSSTETSERTESDEKEAGKKTITKTGRPKKVKRKWLPPLGPPTPDDIKRKFQGSKCSKLYEATDLSSTTEEFSQDKLSADWILKNSEAFSCLSQRR